MPSTSVWLFDAAGDAESALLVLEGLADRGAVRLHDGFVVAWPQGRSSAEVVRKFGSPSALIGSLVESAQTALTSGRSAMVVQTSDADFDEIGRSFHWERSHLLATDADQSLIDQLTEVMTR